MTKRCLICEKPVETNDLGVHGATVWTSHGNYGSTVYDPLSDGVYLEALVCDTCLERRQSLVEEVVVRHVREEVERRPPSF